VSDTLGSEPFSTDGLYTPSGDAGATADAPYIYTLERLTLERDDKRDAVLLDCAKRMSLPEVKVFGKTFSWDDAHCTALTGRGLRMQDGGVASVSVVADGRVYSGRVVPGGIECGLAPGPARNVTVGLPYCARLQTMRADVMLRDGSSAARKRRITRNPPRFWRTLFCKYGESFSKMYEMQFRATADKMDDTPQTQTGGAPQFLPGTYNYDGSICLVQDQPAPLTLLGLDIETEVVS
jgi:hypothetical protein